MLLNNYENDFIIDNNDYNNSLITFEYVGDLSTISCIAMDELNKSWDYNELALINQPFYHLVFK